MHHTVEGAGAVERSTVGQSIRQCLGWRRAVKEGDEATTHQGAVIEQSHEFGE